MTEKKAKPKLMVQNISCILAQQESLGGLFIGNIYGAQKPQILHQYGIRAVLTSSIQTDINYTSSSIPFHLKIQAHDKDDYNLKEHINKCIHFIQEARKYTNVLVHCYAGVSRSVAIVCAYIMWKLNWNFQTTIAFVKAKRVVAKPNDGFLKQLMQIQKILLQSNSTYQQTSSPKLQIHNKPISKSIYSNAPLVETKYIPQNERSISKVQKKISIQTKQSVNKNDQKQQSYSRQYSFPVIQNQTLQNNLGLTNKGQIQINNINKGLTNFNNTSQSGRGFLNKTVSNIPNQIGKQSSRIQYSIRGSTNKLPLAYKPTHLSQNRTYNSSSLIYQSPFYPSTQIPILNYLHSPRSSQQINPKSYTITTNSKYIKNQQSRIVLGGKRIASSFDDPQANTKQQNVTSGLFSQFCGGFDDLKTDNYYQFYKNTQHINNIQHTNNTQNTNNIQHINKSQSHTYSQVNPYSKQTAYNQSNYCNQQAYYDQSNRYNQNQLNQFSKTVNSVLSTGKNGNQKAKVMSRILIKPKDLPGYKHY